MNKIFNLSLLCSALAMSPQLLYAATPGTYLGAGAGYAQIDSLTKISRLQDHQFGGRVFFGYNFNHFFGIESNYSTLNKTPFAYDDYPGFIGNYALNALNLVGKAYLDIGSKNPINLYALAGVAQMHGRFKISYDSVQLIKIKGHGVVPVAGIGINYEPNKQLTVALEAAEFNSKQSSHTPTRIGIPGSTLVTLSLAYKFGTAQ